MGSGNATDTDINRWIIDVHFIVRTLLLITLLRTYPELTDKMISVSKFEGSNS